MSVEWQVVTLSKSYFRRTHKPYYVHLRPLLCVFEFELVRLSDALQEEKKQSEIIIVDRHLSYELMSLLIIC